MHSTFLHGRLSSIQAYSGQRPIFETWFSEIFVAAIRKSLERFNIALLAQKNDQKYRESGRRPNCFMV